MNNIVSKSPKMYDPKNKIIFLECSFGGLWNSCVCVHALEVTEVESDKDKPIEEKKSFSLEHVSGMQLISFSLKSHDEKDGKDVIGKKEREKERKKERKKENIFTFS